MNSHRRRFIAVWTERLSGTVIMDSGRRVTGEDVVGVGFVPATGRLSTADMCVELLVVTFYIGLSIHSYGS